MTTSGWFVTTSAVTRHAVRTTIAIIVATGGFLVARFPDLPALLPVHFASGGIADGWQYKTVARVLLPCFIQISLSVAFGGIAALLLSRRGGDAHGAAVAPTADVRAAVAAAETVLLTTLIWVAFQGYVAITLVRLWTSGVGNLFLYNLFALTGVVLTVVVAARGYVQVGRPSPRPFVASHWRLGQLYKNPDDPALFVPTRDGAQWTLNFGRPVAAALLAVMLIVGLAAPIGLLFLSFRHNFQV